MRGLDNLAYYRVVDEDSVLPRLHRHRQQPRHAPSARAAADDGQPALLGHRDARRRVPVRPRLDAGPRAPAVDRLSAFFDLVRQDPVVSQVKLIAEPWDVGEGGYRSATSRRCGRSGTVGSATRSATSGAASRDARRVRLPLHRQLRPLRDGTRRPTASINFVTAHDGFTLRDLVSYNVKHNRPTARTAATARRTTARGTAGRRPTDDEAVVAHRARRRRNLIATMLLSQGVPMLLGGDEIGRTQGGNNNAYCQDNELSGRLVQRRSRHPALVRGQSPRSVAATQLPPSPLLPGPSAPRRRRAVLVPPDGEPMNEDELGAGYAHAGGVNILDGDAIATKMRITTRSSTAASSSSSSPAGPSWPRRAGAISRPRPTQSSSSRQPRPRTPTSRRCRRHARPRRPFDDVVSHQRPRRHRGE